MCNGGSIKVPHMCNGGMIIKGYPPPSAKGNSQSPKPTRGGACKAGGLVTFGIPLCTLKPIMYTNHVHRLPIWF